MTMFEMILRNMQEALEISKGDKEIGHSKADEVLESVALNTKLTSKQRKQIVLVYRTVEKWYA